MRLLGAVLVILCVACFRGAAAQFDSGLCQTWYTTRQPSLALWYKFDSSGPQDNSGNLSSVSTRLSTLTMASGTFIDRGDGALTLGAGISTSSSTFAVTSPGSSTPIIVAESFLRLRVYMTSSSATSFGSAAASTRFNLVTINLNQGPISVQFDGSLRHYVTVGSQIFDFGSLGYAGTQWWDLIFGISYQSSNSMYRITKYNLNVAVDFYEFTYTASPQASSAASVTMGSTNFLAPIYIDDVKWYATNPANIPLLFSRGLDCWFKPCQLLNYYEMVFYESTRTCTCQLANTVYYAGTDRCAEGCNAGKYLLSSVCTWCPAGKYKSVADASACIDCPMNTYSPTTAATSAATCLVCPADSTSPSTSSAVSACACNAGYTGPNAGPCLPCAVGTYKIGGGSAACTNCAAGTYSGAAAATSAATCLACPVDTISPISSTAVTDCICGVGLAGPAGGPCNFSSACRPGNTSSGGLCVPCYYGTFKATTGDEACTACAAGKKANLGVTACTACVATADVTFSGTCAGGVSTTGTSSGIITDGPSTYGTNINCNWFIASDTTISLTFSQIRTELDSDLLYVFRCSTPTTCTPIYTVSGIPASQSSTYTSNTGYMKIQLTSDGSVTGDGIVAAWTLAAALCKCYPGQYSSLGTAPCTDCAAGTYSGTAAATSAATCVACPAGTSSPSASDAVADCVSSHCNAGYTGPDGGPCSACVPGTYKIGGGSAGCTSCGAGTYSASTGATAAATCLVCPAGSFSDVSGATACTNCSQGMFAVGGASNCTYYHLDKDLTFWFKYQPGYTNGKIPNYGTATNKYISDNSIWSMSTFAKRGMYSAKSCESGGLTMPTWDGIENSVPLDWSNKGITISTWFYIPNGNVPNAPGFKNVMMMNIGFWIFYMDYFGENTPYMSGTGFNRVDLDTKYNYIQLQDKWTLLVVQFYEYSASGLCAFDVYYNTTKILTVQTSTLKLKDIPRITISFAGRSTMNVIPKPCWFWDDTRYYNRRISSTDIAWLFEPCPSGQLLVEDTSLCICHAGFVSVNEDCVACAAGKYAAVGAAVCTNCVSGTYSGVSGASSVTACTNCTAGAYSSVTGANSSTVCTNCVAGTYSSVSGASSSTVCTNCVAGTYSEAGASACVKCTAGTYSNLTGASSSTTCVSCPAGAYSSVAGATSASTCVLCPAGTYSGTAGASACVLCPTSSSSATGSVSITNCSCNAGFYGANSSVCTACASTFTSLPGSLMAADCGCGVNTYTNYNEILNIRVGTVKQSSDAIAGQVATFAWDGQYGYNFAYAKPVSTNSCPWWRADFQTPQYVPSASIDFYRPNWAFYSYYEIQVGNIDAIDANPTCAVCRNINGCGKMTCTSIMSGRYVFVKGWAYSQPDCLNAPNMPIEEVYINGASLFCSSCPANTVSSFSKTSKMCQCNIGNTGPDNGPCTACVEGKYKNTTGSAACTSCSVETYSNMTGASVCTSCPGGTYSKVNGSTSLFACGCEKNMYTKANITNNIQWKCGASKNQVCGVVCNGPSSSSSYPCSNLIDIGGEQTQSEVNYYLNPTKNVYECPWWRVDLGSEQYIDSFDLIFLSNIETSTFVQVQLGNINQVDTNGICQEFLGKTNTQTFLNLKCTDYMKGRYFFIRFRANTGGNCIHGYAALDLKIRGVEYICTACPENSEDLPFSVQRKDISACICKSRFSLDVASSTCTLCSAGKFGVNGNCSNCPSTTYSNVPGATNCSNCSVGYDSIPGSSFCQCAVGYGLTSDGNCALCEAGKFKSVIENVICCPSGMYALQGSPNCTFYHLDPDLRMWLRYDPPSSGVKLQNYGVDKMNWANLYSSWPVSSFAIRGMYSVEVIDSGTISFPGYDPTLAPFSSLPLNWNKKAITWTHWFYIPRATAAAGQSGLCELFDMRFLNDIGTQQAFIQLAQGYTYSSVTGNYPMSHLYMQWTGLGSSITVDNNFNINTMTDRWTLLTIQLYEYDESGKIAIDMYYNTTKIWTYNTNLILNTMKRYRIEFGGCSLYAGHAGVYFDDQRLYFRKLESNYIAWLHEPCRTGDYLYEDTSVCGCPPSFVREASSCVQCGVGKIALQLAEACTNCTAGTYSIALGTSACTDCTVGTYSSVSGATSAMTCTGCPLGTYSSVVRANSSTLCKDCPAGTYSSTVGLSACTACKSYLTSLPGSRNVSDCGCRVNEYAGTITCISCPANSISQLNSKNFSDCKCNVGYTGDGSTCTACVAGKYKDVSGSAPCSNCPVGTYSIGTGANSTTTCKNCLGDPGVSVDYICGCAANTYANGTAVADIQWRCGINKNQVCSITCNSGQSCSNFIDNGANYLSTYSNVDINGPWVRIDLETTQFIHSFDLLYNTYAGPWSAGQVYSQATRVQIEVGDLDALGQNTVCLSFLGIHNEYNLFINLKCGSKMKGRYFFLRHIVDATKYQRIEMSNLAIRGTRNICQQCPIGSSSNFSLDFKETCVCDNGFQFGTTTCLACVSGKFGVNGGCSNCPNNTYSSVVGATNCTNCSVGYSSIEGSSTCMCATGYGATSDGNCAICEAGKFKSTSGKSNCTVCATGKYMDDMGATACLSCPTNANPSVSALADSRCTCNAGASGNGSVCVLCGAGKYKGVTGNGSCVDCSANTYSATVGATAAGACLGCPGNAVSGAGSGIIGACVCNVGATGPNGGVCSLCVLGKYKAVNGTAACTDCLAGSYSGALGANTSETCLSCADNSSSVSGSSAVTACTCSTGASGPNGGPCALCVPGKYKTVIGSTVCLNCSANTFSSVTGATSSFACSNCGDNSQSGGSSAACVCSRGYTGPDGGVCLACVAGTFKTQIGSAECALCANHTFSGVVGSTNASVCQACQANAISAAGSVGQEYCYCKPGYAHLEGRHSCRECTPGTYNSQLAQRACSNCTIGMYSLNYSAISPETCKFCPAGQWSPEGSANCNLCPPYSRTLGISGLITDCVCDPGYIGPGGSTCVACAAGLYKDFTGPDGCAVCPALTSSFPGTERATDCWCVSGYIKVAGVCVAMIPRPIQVSGSLENLPLNPSPAQIQNATEQLRRSVAAQFNVATELVQVDRVANSSNVQVLLFARSETEATLLQRKVSLATAVPTQSSLPFLLLATGGASVGEPRTVLITVNITYAAISPSRQSEALFALTAEISEFFDVPVYDVSYTFDGSAGPETPRVIISVWTSTHEEFVRVSGTAQALLAQGNVTLPELQMDLVAVGDAGPSGLNFTRVLIWTNGSAMSAAEAQAGLQAVIRQLSWFYNVPEYDVHVVVTANASACVDFNGTSTCFDEIYSVQVFVEANAMVSTESLQARHLVMSETVQTPQPLVLELPFELDNIFYFTDTGVSDFYVEMELVDSSGLFLSDAQVAQTDEVLTWHLAEFFGVDASRVHFETIAPRFPMLNNASNVRVWFDCEQQELPGLLDRASQLTETATILVQPATIAGLANAVQAQIFGQMVDGQFVQCPPNFVVDAEACKCKRGYVLAGALCVPCAAGAYSTALDAHECANCSTATFSLGGATACTSCHANSNSAVGSTSQDACQCDPGYFFFLTLLEIGDGAYNTADNYCLPCVNGSFKGDEGNWNCSACSTAYYSSDALSCNTCNAGYAPSGTNSSVCVSCPKGSFKPTPDSSPCRLCAADSFSNITAALSCNTCPAGYRSLSGTVNSTDCCALNSRPQKFSTDCAPPNLARSCATGGVQSCPTSANAYYTWTTYIYYPSRANDAVIDGCMSFIGDETYGRQQWWKLDLQRVETIKSLKIWNRNCYYTEFLVNFQIQLSNDGITFTNCATGQNGAMSAPWFTLHVCEGSARYVRISIDTGGRLQLDEVQVYGVPPACGSEMQCSCNTGYTGPDTGASKGQCSACLPGTYKATNGTANCTACPLNSNSSVGSQNITDCICDAWCSGPNGGPCIPKNSTLNVSSSVYQCSPGYTGPDRTGPCVACAVGTYKNVPGSVACSSCAPGQYQDAVAKTACSSCAPDTFQNASGSVACQACPAGFRALSATTAMQDCCGFNSSPRNGTACGSGVAYGCANIILSYSTTACVRFIALTPKPSFESISTRANAAIGTVPTYNALGGPNGKGHVSFDQTKGQFLEAGTRTFNIATNGGLTIVAVVRFIGPADWWQRLLDMTNGPAQDNIQLARPTGSNELRLTILNGNYAAFGVTSSNTVAANSWVTVVVSYRTSTNVCSLTVNGAVSTTTMSLVDRTVSRTFMGRSWETDYLNADLAGVFVVDEYLSTAATTAISDAMIQGLDLTSTPCVCCLSTTFCSCNTGYTGPDAGASKGQCSLCLPGTYKSTNGSAACTSCPANSNSSVGSMVVTSCSCNPGYTGPNGGPCPACDAGKFKNASGSQACDVCAANTYSASGVSVCTSCLAGFQSPAGSTQVLDCCDPNTTYAKNLYDTLSSTTKTALDPNIYRAAYVARVSSAPELKYYTSQPNPPSYFSSGGYSGQAFLRFSKTSSTSGHNILYTPGSSFNGGAIGNTVVIVIRFMENIKGVFYGMQTGTPANMFELYLSDTLQFCVRSQFQSWMSCCTCTDTAVPINVWLQVSYTDNPSAWPRQTLKVSYLSTTGTTIVLSKTNADPGTWGMNDGPKTAIGYSPGCHGMSNSMPMTSTLNAVCDRPNFDLAGFYLIQTAASDADIAVLLEAIAIGTQILYDKSSTCQCNAGFSGTGRSNCASCAPGTYKSEVRSASCSLCAANTYSTAVQALNVSTCLSCPNNSVSVAGRFECECNFGYEGDMFSCSTCVPGKFKRVLGTSACLDCPANMEAPGFASVVCASLPGYNGLGYALDDVARSCGSSLTGTCTTLSNGATSTGTAADGALDGSASTAVSVAFNPNMARSCGTKGTDACAASHEPVLLGAASLANDGDTNTRSETDYQLGSVRPYWRVDFGQSRTVFRVKILSLTWQYLKDFKITVGDSADAKSSANVVCADYLTGSGSSYMTYTCEDSLNGRYLYVVNGPHASNYLSISEIVVETFDYTATPSLMLPWWAVDFEVERALSGMVIQAQASSVIQVRVGHSTDPLQNAICAQNRTLLTGVNNNITCASAMLGRYLSVIGTGNTVLVLNEVRVLGAPTAQCAAGTYKPLVGNTNCTACPSFSTSVVGATSVGQCSCRAGYLDVWS